MQKSKNYIFRAPISVQIELTNICNNRCVFCYNGDVNINPKYMTLDQAKHIINELSENKVFTVVFTGGEPMLNKHLPAIITYAKKCGLHTGIITNGTFMTPDIMENLLEAGLEGIQVSILGHNDTLHDEIAINKGAFHKAIAGLKMANDMGFRTSVNTTITRLNFQYLDEIIETVVKAGTKNFSITRYIHNDFKREDRLSLTIKEYNELVRKLLNWKSILNVKISNCTPLCSIDDSKNPVKEVLTIMAPCDCAKTWIGIDVNGTVLPCPSFRHDCGSLNVKKLEEIWKNDSFLIKIRQNEFCLDGCKLCQYTNICGGGCKSTNIDKEGKLMGVDPYITNN